jgi:hypothetical protein
MRTTQRTITRRDHERRQRCGPGRSEIRIVQVRETDVTLARDDVDQLGLLDDAPPPMAAPACPRGHGRHSATEADAEPKPILFSYWRNQPHGPRSALRKMILVDVRG